MSHTDSMELICSYCYRLCMLSHLSLVMLPVTTTQIETGPRLDQLRDTTANQAGSTGLLSGNGSWCTLHRPMDKPAGMALNNINLTEQITLRY